MNVHHLSCQWMWYAQSGLDEMTTIANRSSILKLIGQCAFAYIFMEFSSIINKTKNIVDSPPKYQNETFKRSPFGEKHSRIIQRFFEKKNP